MLDELFEALFERRKKRYRYEYDDEWEPPRRKRPRHWEDVQPEPREARAVRPPRRYEDDDGWYERAAPRRRSDWDEDDWDDEWVERRRYERGEWYGRPPKKKPWWKKLGDLFEFGD